MFEEKGAAKGSKPSAGGRWTKRNTERSVGTRLPLLPTGTFSRLPFGISDRPTEKGKSGSPWRFSL
jgi:hypothetical protein